MAAESQQLLVFFACWGASMVLTRARIPYIWDELPAWCQRTVCCLLLVELPSYTLRCDCNNGVLWCVSH
jgi:hypothetical protein